MNTLDYKKFYSELGKLLYAMADIDHVISPAEKKALQKMVRDELVPAEKNTDEFGTDAAFYAEIEFDYLDETITGSDVALESFLNYVEEHQHLIDQRMRNLCYRLVERLADAYYGKNKKENELLQVLKAKLKVRS